MKPLFSLLAIALVAQSMLAGTVGYVPPVQGQQVPASLYSIDRDHDGYGVGCSLGPDADDSDPKVNTYDSAITKYGDLTGVLNHLGYNPTRVLTSIPDSYEPGDVVVLPAGTYSGDTLAYFNYVNGTSSKPIVLMAAPGQKVIFDATNTGIKMANSSNIIIDGITLDNTTGGGQGTDIAYSNNITVKNVESLNHTRGFLAGQDIHGVTISSSVVHDSGSHGIYLASRDMPNSDITISGNVIYGNANFGIQHNGRVRDLVIENNIIHSNSYGGISLIEGVRDSIITNNLIFNNDKQGIVFYTYDAPPSSYIYPYPEYNNVISGNTIWVGRYNREGTNEDTKDFAPIEFNDTAGVGIYDTYIQHNILCSQYGPLVFFQQADEVGSTHIVGNAMYRAYGDENVYDVEGDWYDQSFINDPGFLAAFNVYGDPNFANVSVDYNTTPWLFDFTTSVTPEPATVGLLSLGVLLVLRRRTRQQAGKSSQ